MKTIHLTDAELAIVRNAVHGYLNAFGHNEHEVVELLQSALKKIDGAAEDTEPEELTG